MNAFPFPPPDFFALSAAIYKWRPELRFSLPFSLIFYLFFAAHPSVAQELPFQTAAGEELRSLEVNPKLFRSNKVPPASHLKNNNYWIYIIDTLTLPFIDDFSSSRIKRFSPDAGNVTAIGKAFFEVNGNYPDSIEIKNDTTWSYQFNSITQQYDSFPNQPDLFITYYENNNPDSISALTQPTDTDTVWSNITYQYNLSDTDTIILSRDTVYYNSKDTFYFVQDSNFFLWSDSFAFINTSFGVNPPTIGIATFDGLNSSGEAYDFSVPNINGPADRLTSKPIDLSNLTSDSSVVLSFYYQPQGLGDYPDPEDSLVLEFYSPADSLWNWAWSTAGITTAQSYQQPVFQLVKIAITDPKYLKKGFHLRFRNYATLAGMLDIWNIDYVYLDKNRNINDNSVNDFGFVSIGNSFVNNYTSMPMKAFKGNASLYMVQNFPVKLANLSNASLSNDSNRYFVYDEYETVKYKESVNLQQSFSPLSQQTIYHSVYSSPNNFQFTPSDSERTVFKIKFTAEQPGPDLCLFNDTVIHRQVFDSYYSYDDGSAEGIYSLGNKPGVKLACKFAIAIPDSLKAIYLYFPRIKNDVTQFTFKILVWGDNSGIPGNILYQSGDLDNPKYSESINDFIRYEIPPLALNGTFYIGWQQTTGDKIYLGFDKNINNQSKIFHTLAQNNSWNNTTLSGTLMMRPDFGNAEPPARVVNMDKKAPSFTIYPNPASNLIHVGRPGMEGETTSATCLVKIFNLLGEEMWRQTIFSPQSITSIDISSIPNGLYFLQIEESFGSPQTEKLLIAR